MIYKSIISTKYRNKIIKISQFIDANLCFMINIVFVKTSCHEKFTFYGEKTNYKLSPIKFRISKKEDPTKIWRQGFTPWKFNYLK